MDEKDWTVRSRMRDAGRDEWETMVVEAGHGLKLAGHNLRCGRRLGSEHDDRADGTIDQRTAKADGRRRTAGGGRRAARSGRERGRGREVMKGSRERGTNRVPGKSSGPDSTRRGGSSVHRLAQRVPSPIGMVHVAFQDTLVPSVWLCQPDKIPAGYPLVGSTTW